MKNLAILLAAGCLVSCQREVATPSNQVSTTPTVVSAEKGSDFTSSLENDVWGRFYYTPNGKFHSARLVGSFNDYNEPSFSIADDPAGKGEAVLWFSPAASTEATVRIVAEDGAVLHEQTVPLGTTTLDLRNARVSDHHGRVGSIVQLLTRKGSGVVAQLTMSLK